MQHATPDVGELTVHSFPRYDALALPMLILFLDLSECGTVPSRPAAPPSHHHRHPTRPGATVAAMAPRAEQTT